MSATQKHNSQTLRLSLTPTKVAKTEGVYISRHIKYPVIMKLSNFTIASDNIAFEKDGEYYDLHYNFDFMGFNYDISKREIILFWVKNNGDWVPKNAPEKIDLIINEVSFLKTQERDNELPFTEDNCLDCIGFMYYEDMRNMDDYPAHHEPSNDFPHLYLKFMSGFTLKISAENSTLNVI